jgi:hypothetical protein
LSPRSGPSAAPHNIANGAEGHAELVSQLLVRAAALGVSKTNLDDLIGLQLGMPTAALNRVSGVVGVGA